MPPSDRRLADGLHPQSTNRFRPRQFLALRSLGKRQRRNCRLIDSITERFVLLAEYPHVGRRRDEDLRAGLRSFPVGDYVIFYRVQDADIVVLRVLHGRRDIKAEFGR